MPDWYTVDEVRWYFELERARRRYQRLEKRNQRRIWRQVIARELTRPLLADGLSYHRRCLARRRRR